MHWHGGYLATGARHFPRLIPNLNTVEAVRLATVIGLFPIFREGSSHFPRLGGTLLGGWKLEEGYRHQPTLGQVQHTVQRAVGDVCGMMVPDSEWGTVNKEGSAQARWRDIVATPQIHARRPGEDSKW